MKHIDLMIFDLDGTLVDSGRDIVASVNYTLKSLHIPTMKHEEIIRFVGDGVQKLIERSLGKESQHLFDKAMDIFSDYYARHILDTTCLCDSVIEVLDHFRDKKKVIITNKRRYFTLKMTDALGISKYFEEIIGADSTAYRKPDTRLFIPLLERVHAAYNDTVVIGDGVNDIMLAKNTGVLSCALLNGLTHRDILLALDPDFACERLRELLKIFD
ncbi:HAD family hydrolase [bacterium]|jgi:phosphoglycolate phosphatase|nr:MAG: HAD family hydrolase [bacterium]